MEHVRMVAPADYTVFPPLLNQGYGSAQFGLALVDYLRADQYRKLPISTVSSGVLAEPPSSSKPPAIASFSMICLQRSDRLRRMWRAKALIQFVLAHLPYGYTVNHWLQRARGAYSEPTQINALVCQVRYLRKLNEHFPIEGLTALEIGAGWQGTGSVALSLFGALKIYEVDHQPHLRFALIHRLLGLCIDNIDRLSEASGLPHELLLSRVNPAAQARTLGATLDALRVAYLAPCDAGATNLDDRSIDLVYSYGVLEHIPEHALEAFTKEWRRILKLSGRSYHNIGLHDHFHKAGLGNGVNFLRYPEWLWAFFCYNGILYHNRLRLPHYLELFRRYGFEPLRANKELRDINLRALEKIQVDKKFRGLSKEDLAASSLYIEMTLAVPDH